MGLESETPHGLSPDVDAASRDAVHAQKNAAQKVETARQVQMEETAYNAASQVVERVGDIMQARMEHVLSMGTEKEKALILARVPYICQDIKEINKKFDVILGKMEEVKKDLSEKDDANDKKYVNHDQFGPVQKVVYGLIGLVLTAVGAAVIALVVTK